MFGFIKKRLKDLCKTQTELSKYLNIDSARLSEILGGRRTVQGREVAPMAKFLKLDVAKFALYVAGQIDEETLLKEEKPLTDEEKAFIDLLRKSKQTTAEDVNQTAAG